LPSLLHAFRRPGDRDVNETVLERISAGEPGAVDECIGRYSPLVWSLARRHLRQHADGEDAVQEIFIEIWRNAARFDPTIASEATFIATIARRRLIDRQRKQSRTLGAHSLVEDTPSRSPSQEQHLENDDEASRARHLLGGLRDDERRVLEMTIFEGRTQREIAEAADMPLGTVKTHARRGMNRLRAMLGAEVAPATLKGNP